MGGKRYELNVPSLFVENGWCMMAIGELADETIEEALRVHRNSILAAEVERLAGVPAYTVEEVRTMLSEKFCHAESQEL